MPVRTVTQTGKAQGDIRAQKLKVVGEKLPQKIRARKDATQDRTGRLNPKLTVKDEVKGEQRIDKMGR